MSGGQLMIDVEGLALTVQDRDVLCHPLVAGVTLFARNYRSPGQLRDLCSDIHSLRAPTLIIAVDQEGGRVQRFMDGFTRLPPAGALGRAHRSNETDALEVARCVGLVMACELREQGIDLSFAPILDVRSVDSAVIGQRAFDADPDIVTRLAGAVIDGMQSGGLLAVGKHFPGHGAVAGDSHFELPVDARGWSEIEPLDLAPFQALAGRLAGVMTGHLLFPAVDSELITFSSHWLGYVLRQKLEFRGAIFSDDLTMAGAKGKQDPLERVVGALRSGCNFALLCNDRPAALSVLERWASPVRQAPAVVPKDRTTCDTTASDSYLHAVERVRAFTATLG